jgi:hypothetical protein
MDMNNFIPNTKKKLLLYKESKKITSTTFLKENTIRKFYIELSKIPDYIYKVDNNEKYIYKNDLMKIEDFEEGNMKFYAYCFLISRSFNFNYDEFKKKFFVEKMYVSKLNEIYEQFKPSNVLSEFFDTYLEFIKDISINCYVIMKIRNFSGDINYDQYEEEEEEIDEEDFENRRDMFIFD